MGTAKSQDGQQKGTLALVKRKVATALSMVKPVKKIDIHVHLLQFQPSRLASKILPHPYTSCFVAISKASRLPRSLLGSLPPGSSWKILCFSPSSHGREPELQQRMLSFVASYTLWPGHWCFCCGSLFCFLLGAILVMTHKMSSCINPHCW